MWRQALQATGRRAASFDCPKGKAMRRRADVCTDCDQGKYQTSQGRRLQGLRAV